MRKKIFFCGNINFPRKSPNSAFHLLVMAKFKEEEKNTNKIQKETSALLFLFINIYFLG